METYFKKSVSTKKIKLTLKNVKSGKYSFNQSEVSKRCTK